MYDVLKTIATINNWVFQYARKDYANLFDEAEQIGVPHIFLDPVQIDTVFDEFNEPISTSYEGSFMCLVSSDIDEENYDYKYQTHIKPLATTALNNIKDYVRCNTDISITNWREVEVINVFDYNLDGILVTYKLDEQ